MPRYTSLKQSWALGVASLMIVGCSAATDPSPKLQAGQYPLASVNDLPLPVTLGSGGGSVVSGALRIDRDSVVIEQTLAAVPGEAGLVQVIQRENFTIEYNGSTFVLHSVERQIVDTGYVESLRIVVRHHFDGTGTGQVQLNEYSR